MSGCVIKISSKDDPLAHAFYQALLKEGISCKDLDKGYGVLNLDGKQCKSKKTLSCGVGKGDGVVLPQEVNAYVINRYNKYYKLIKKVLGRPVPWVLDDQDPTTDFDAKIRKEVQAQINRIKGILKKQGVKEGTEKYKEKLAVGLFYLISIPGKKLVKKELAFSNMITKELDQAGLSEYKKYLLENGGLGIDGDYSREHSALDALKNKEGECTEKSKILYAVFKQAGFKPCFIFVEIRGVKSKKVYLQKYLKNWTEAFLIPEFMYHVAIGLRVNKKLRYFDPSIFDSNAAHNPAYSLTLRQYLSFDILNHTMDKSERSSSDKLIAEYTKSIEINPQSAQSYVNRGVEWIGRGEFDKALADYKKALEIYPRMPMAFFNLGGLWYRKGELDKAILNYSKVIIRDPKFASAYFKRGEVWDKKGELDKALADFTEYIRLKPTDAIGYLSRGIVFGKKGDLDKSNADFTFALKINPNLVVAHNNRGLNWTRKGELDKAIEDFTKALTINPNYPDAYMNRGAVMFLKNEHDKAITDFRQAIKVDPKQDLAYANLGVALIFKGNLKEAIGAFADLLKLSPNNSDFLIESVSQASTIRWKKDKALKKIEKRFEKETGGFDIVKIEAILLISYSLWDAGNPTGAIDRLRTISTILEFKKKPSRSTKKFFSKIFGLMPLDMAKNEEAKAIVKAIKAKLR